MYAHPPRRILGILPRIGVTCLLLLPTVLVPYLEINATHLLNPQWPAHARLHEGWQLMTNSALGLLALAWTWSRGGLARACALGAIVTGSFVVAWLLRGMYGGSMAGTATSGVALLGYDAALVAMAGSCLAYSAIGTWQCVHGGATPSSGPAVRQCGSRTH